MAVTTVTNVSINPPTILLATDETQVFNAIVTGLNAPTQIVSWSISGAYSNDTKIEPLTGQSTTLTIGADETATSVTLTATSTVPNFTNMFGTATISIPASGSTVSGVSVTPPNIEVQRGLTQSFSANVTGSGGHSTAVSWTVEGSNTGSTITPAGLLTVAAGENAATLTVRATSVQNTSVSGTAIVTVTAAGGTLPGNLVVVGDFKIQSWEQGFGIGTDNNFLREGTSQSRLEIGNVNSTNTVWTVMRNTTTNRYVLQNYDTGRFLNVKGQVIGLETREALLSAPFEDIVDFYWEIQPEGASGFVNGTTIIGTNTAGERGFLDHFCAMDNAGPNFRPNLVSWIPTGWRPNLYGQTRWRFLLES
jgi:hypothetical protein